MRLFQASGIFHYDITAVPGTSIKDLNINLIRDYFKTITHLIYTKNQMNQSIEF